MDGMGWVGDKRRGGSFGGEERSLMTILQAVAFVATALMRH
jgi:hypothetical protein